jgi:predicted GNAT superfamily acetyltransferase
MHHSVTIRRFADHDLEPAMVLNNVNVPELNELDYAEVERLAGLAEAALVAEVLGEDGQSIFAGFCWVLGPGQPYASLNYGWFSRRYNEFIYLDRIAVHSDFRRFGIGRGFYAALVEQFTGSHPVLLCEVNVRPRNEPSLKFHHSVGFREVGQQETDGGKKTVSLLELPLISS